MKKIWWTIIIIFIVIALVVVIKIQQNGIIDEKTAKCIGDNSELYIQYGCHACEIQEEIFGENYQNLNVIDCFYNSELCIQKEIIKIPTWIINGEKYTSVRSIDELKELTGC